MSTPIVPVGYRSEWALYDDWCRAYHLPSCPTDPMTVAHFLDFDPDLSPGTLRRRVAAINTVHRRAGHVSPGTATAVRRLLSRRDRHVERAQQVIRTLPTTGWPSGLFGRRDALLLHLVCVLGLPVGSIADLRCDSLTVVGDALHIAPPHNLELRIDRTDHYELLAIWSRWAQLQQLMARLPSPRSWITPLRDTPPVDTATATALRIPEPPLRPGAALLPAFDRWGTPQSLPGTEDPGLSARAVHTIIATHLFGAGRAEGPSRIAQPAVPASSQLSRPSEDEPPVLADVYAEGIAARRLAMASFEGIDEVFDDIDRRGREILERTAQLLDAVERGSDPGE